MSGGSLRRAPPVPMGYWLVGLMLVCGAAALHGEEPAASGVRSFDPARHLPRETVGYAHARDAGVLAQALWPGHRSRASVEALLGAAMPHLPESWTALNRVVRPALAEALTLSTGAVTISVRSLDTAGLPEVVAAIELKGDAHTLAASIDRCGIALAVRRGAIPHVERFVVGGAYAADAYHTVRGPLFRCQLGTHLVITTSRASLRDVVNRYAGTVQSPGLSDGPLWSGDADNAATSTATAHVALDLREVCRQLVYRRGGENQQGWRAILGAAGLSELGALRLSLDVADDVLRWRLQTGERPRGLLAVLRAGLGEVKIPEGPGGAEANVARWIPAGTRMVTAAALRPGRAARALDRFLRARVPELSVHLDRLYHRLESRLKINVQRDLFQLPDVTVYAVAAGDLTAGAPEVFLVPTRSLNAYWDVAKKAGRLVADSADVEHLHVALQLRCAGRPLPSLHLARSTLGGGWSVVAAEPLALARYLTRTRAEPSLAEFPEVAARLVKQLQTATWGAAPVDRQALIALRDKAAAELTSQLAIGSPGAAPAAAWTQLQWTRLAAALRTAPSAAPRRAWLLTLAAGLRPEKLAAR